MKDFAGSTITYYDLARKKVLKKYPRLISFLVVLVLISMTGLALYLISDLVSFATNPDHKGLMAELDLKALGNGTNNTNNINKINDIKDASATNNKTKGNVTVVPEMVPHKGNNTAALASTNLTGISQKNITNTSTAAAGKSSITSVKSSSSSSRKHHSSSSSSSKSSSSKASSNASITATSPQANQSTNQSTAILSNLTSQGNLSAPITSAANATMNLTQNSSIDEREEETVPAASATSFALTSLAQSSFSNPMSSVPARVPEKMIQFKTLVESKATRTLQFTSESKADQKAPSTAKTANTKKTIESSKKAVAASSSETNNAQQIKSKQADQKNDKIASLRERAAQLRAKAK